MTDTAYSLLDDPFLGVELMNGRREKLTLPGLMAALARDEIQSCTAVQAHQRHAWHATLVQIAAICLHMARETSVPSDEAEWKRLILEATPKPCHDTAWCLVAPDDVPAFMQPAIEPGYTGKIGTRIGPVDLDILVTSRNHDIKIGGGYGAAPDEWLAALVSLQVQAGYGGQGNWQIARMNSARGCRAGFGLVPPGGPGARFVRDVLGHLLLRDKVLASHPFKAEGGLAFLWMAPWKDGESLSLQVLDPYFVEVARRIRFSVEDGGLTCKAFNNKRARVEASEARGNLGDLWTCVLEDDKEVPKALTPDAGQIGYSRLIDVLLGGKRNDVGYQPSPLTAPLPGDPKEGMRFSARFIGMDDGKHKGFHERSFPVARAMLAGFGKREGDRYGLLGRAMVKAAGDIGSKSLTIALMIVAQGGEGEVDFKKNAAVKLKDVWLADYHREVDRIFFERLAAACARLESGEREPALLVEWDVELYGLAKSALQKALDTSMLKAVQAGRARARADTTLSRMFRAISPDAHAVLFPPRQKPETESGDGDEVGEAILEVADA